MPVAAIVEQEKNLVGKSKMGEKALNKHEEGAKKEKKEKKVEKEDKKKEKKEKKEDHEDEKMDNKMTKEEKKEKKERKEKRKAEKEAKKEEKEAKKEEKKRKVSEEEDNKPAKKVKTEAAAPAVASKPAPAAVAAKPAVAAAVAAAKPAPSTDLAAPAATAIINVDEWRATNRISVPMGTPDPYQSFSQLGDVPPSINKGFVNLKYIAPTPIQAQTWPIALTGKDMVGIAETGSGKTMSFLLPAIIRFHRLKAEGKISGKKIAVVVMAPTRELAQQIHENAVKFLMGTQVFVTCIYGGESKGNQIRQLTRGCHVLIATPGRMIDLYGMGYLDLTEVFYLVLDEADRMLDMGFEPQIRELIEKMPKERQTMMFTATFPKEIRSLAYSFQNSPVMLKIGSEDLTGNKNITQKTYVVEPFEKYSKLKEILSEVFTENCRILVFANTKRACDAMAQRLWDEGLPVNAIHGDLDQHQRNKAMAQFKDGSLPILFATDVAARGLDVKGVKHVINADFPTFFENYVHRIGRTGRAGEQGFSHSLVCLDSDAGLSDLVSFLEQCAQDVPAPLKERFGHKQSSGRGGFRSGGGGRGGRGGRGGSRFARGGGGGSRFDKGGRGGGGGGRGGSRGGAGFSFNYSNNGGSGGSFGGGFGGGGRGGGRGGFSGSTEFFA